MGLAAEQTAEAGVARVRGMMADAAPVARVRRRELSGKPGQWVPDALGLPPECPVTPLGVTGARVWIVDPIGQIQALEPPFSKMAMLAAFAGDDKYLSHMWPRWTKGGDIDGYANEDVAACLLKAAFAKGAWNIAEGVRGRGVWRDSGGTLVVHTGKKLLINGREVPTGQHDGLVYPTLPSIPGPWPGEKLTAGESAVRLIPPMLRTWSWARPDVDPQLVLGWIGVGYLGAALPWRSAIYLTGDAGSGKSTLQDLLKGLFGEWLINTTNTTAAGVYQHVGQNCLPVAVDEFESKGDNSKAKALLELARQASSGGRGLRGGDKHTGFEFCIQSAFAFSSINAPPLDPQDVSRFALLRLQELRKGLERPNMDPQQLAIAGRCILRRLLDEWDRFPETIKAFRDELAAGGMDARGQDTFGTLLACADMILHEGWNEERLAHPVDGDLVRWSQLLDPRHLAEFEDRTPNWRLCLAHLLTVSVDAWRGGLRQTVGQILADYVDQKDNVPTRDEMQKFLGQAGLALVRRKGREWLAVPNQSPLTRTLFHGSKWAGDVGASMWSGALRQSPPGTIHDYAKARVNGDACNCTLISLEGLYGPDGIMRLDDDDHTRPPDPCLPPEPEPL